MIAVQTELHHSRLFRSIRFISIILTGYVSRNDETHNHTDCSQPAYDCFDWISVHLPLPWHVRHITFVGRNPLPSHHTQLIVPTHWCWVWSVPLRLVHEPRFFPSTGGALSVSWLTFAAGMYFMITWELSLFVACQRVWAGIAVIELLGGGFGNLYDYNIFTIETSYSTFCVVLALTESYIY